jgi:hypothetical protein
VSEVVTLTSQELSLAAIVGVLRRIDGLRRERPAAYGYRGTDPWATDIEGCAAELAVAKYVDRHWTVPLANGSLDTIPADVGTDIQVRSTRRDDGCLIVHKQDSDDHRFWLVITHRAPNYILAGWLWGHEAKRDEFWRTGERPAYFVPQSHLHEPLTDDDLVALLETGVGPEEFYW